MLFDSLFPDLIRYCTEETIENPITASEQSTIYNTMMSSPGKLATILLLAAMASAPKSTDAFQGRLISTTAFAGPTSTVLSMRRSPFMSPAELFREFDELFDRQLPAGFDDFFDRSFMLGSPRQRLLKPDSTKKVSDNVVLRRSSPWYEITEDDTQFQLAVDVPGIKASDMKIQLEQDVRVLRLMGERKVQEGSMKSERSFEKAFILGKRIDTDRITATLSDGVVVITAPKKVVEPKNVVQIPVTENPPLGPVVAEEETVASDATEHEEHDHEKEETITEAS